MVSPGSDQNEDFAKEFNFDHSIFTIIKQINK